MTDTATNEVSAKDYVKGCQDLAILADALGLDNEAYKLRSMAVSGERALRKAANEAKRAAGEAVRGRKPTDKK